MEPTNYSCRKDNDLPNLQGIMFQPLIFRGGIIHLSFQVHGLPKKNTPSSSIWGTPISLLKASHQAGFPALHERRFVVWISWWKVGWNWNKHIPNAPCREYLPTFPLECSHLFPNVGKHSKHGASEHVELYKVIQGRNSKQSSLGCYKFEITKSVP